MLVLLDGARPERLGELVRTLLPSHPHLEVHTDAVRLARADQGALVILIPSPDQATWLNLERPLLAHRALRVILFSDPGTTTALARRAPDFFHWISHRLECPLGPPRPAVRGIQRALLSRAAGVAWSGGDFEAALSAALPGRHLRRASAALSYEQMVEAARPSGNAWLAWTDVDGPFRLQRVRWAMAEAGRRGRCVLVDPAVTTPAFVPVHGTLLSVPEARTRLEDAGVGHAGRLAALLELEPEAVEIAAGLRRMGVNETEIEAAAAEAADPGVVMAEMAEGRGVVIGAALRARASGVGSPSRDAVETALRERTGAERWVEAARGAIDAGDARVAVLWAQRGLALAGEDPRALQVAGRALQRCGRYVEAAALSQKAVLLGEERRQTREAYYPDALVDWAFSLLRQARPAEAERLLRKAVAAERRRVGRDHTDYAVALHDLAIVLRDRAKLEEAERALTRSLAIARRKLSEGHANIATAMSDLGSVLLEKGEYGAAEALLREASERLEVSPGPEHPSTATALHGLGRALLVQRESVEAERLFRQAAKRQAKIWGEEHPAYATSLHDLARSLEVQGRYDEAELYLREALSVYERSTGPETPAYAASLHELAGMMLDRGEYAKAEKALRRVIAIEQKALGMDHPSLCPSLCDLALALWLLQTNAREAEALARRALEIAMEKRGPRHPDTAHSLYMVAFFQAARGDAKALETARRAHDALVHAAGPDAPAAKAAAQLLDRLARSS
ncbi:uncharacterized protein SOCEGT47_031600 [Sorangium cellulosum]|uniref:Uncharacterized protein n=1 Tax=Sorangium cellulosum TaxID=56 RepID=A0A4P2Q171_SORCE|nr:uncharacterized protein SOCEGT47_031600 [Sorangium cellulosum]